MEKKRSLAIIGCSITILIVLGAIIFYPGTSSERTLAERMALESSDIEAIDMSVGEGSSFIAYFNNSTSNYWYAIGGNEFNGYIHIHTFNSTSQCQSEYSKGIDHNLTDNYTTVIGLGNGTDRGYVTWNTTWKAYAIDFSIDNVIVTMNFRIMQFQPWDKELWDGKVVFITIAQYHDIVTVLND